MCIYKCVCVCVCVCVCIYVCIERERFRFKELAHMTVEASMSKICRAGQQAGDPGKSWYCSLGLKAEFPLPQGMSVRLLLRLQLNGDAHSQYGGLSALLKVC